jgi:hypothetical protein
LAQVNVRLEANRTAVTTAMVCLHPIPPRIADLFHIHK